MRQKCCCVSKSQLSRRGATAPSLLIRGVCIRRASKESGSKVNPMCDLSDPPAGNYIKLYVAGLTQSRLGSQPVFASFQREVPLRTQARASPANLHS